MTRRRWMADEASGDRAALIGNNARHLSRVLRARVGERFDIVAEGRVRAGTITSANGERVEFALGDEIAAAGPAVGVELWLAVFKFDRMEWAIEKATELGVASIMPVIARRTETHLAAASAKRVERWRKIAKEAAQQSRRADVPEICQPAKLADALGGADGGLKVVLSETERARSLRDAFSQAEADGKIRLAVGPEGGWTPDELNIFAKHGWIAASMGQTILRAETAAIAAMAIANAEIHRSQ